MFTCFPQRLKGMRWSMINSEESKVWFGVNVRSGQASPLAQRQFWRAAISCFSTLLVKGRLMLRDLRRRLFDSFSSASSDETTLCCSQLAFKRRVQATAQHLLPEGLHNLLRGEGRFSF